jgi:hypothetical protein
MLIWAPVIHLRKELKRSGMLCCAWLRDCDELMDIIIYGIINNKQQRIKEKNYCTISSSSDDVGEGQWNGRCP